MVLGAIGAISGTGISIVIRAVDRFSGPMRKINTQIIANKRLFQKNFGEVAKIAQTTGIALTAMGVVGALAIKSFVSEAISFESAFIGVRKTVELTEAEFKQLEDRFKSLSTEIPVTFQELSSIGEIAGQLGVSGVENLEKFTKTIADISATTNLTAEAAATDFARLANVMQEPLENIDRMGSVVVELGNNFATTEGEILSFATRIAGVANIVGLTTADTLALGAAFSAVGVQAEAGGTAVQKILLKMNESVVAGGSKLRAFADTAGVTTEEFARLFREDASRAFELFTLGLGKQGDNAIRTLDTLELKDVRLTRSLLSLANAGDLITRTFKTSDKEWKKNTALTIEAEKRYESMESQIKILSNKFKILSADLGKELFPILEDIIDVVGTVVSGFSSLSDGTKKAIIFIGLGITALFLIIGPLLILVSLISAVSAVFVLLTTAVGSTALAVTILLGPLGLLLAAIGIVMALGYTKHKKDVDEVNFAYNNLTGSSKLLSEQMAITHDEILDFMTDDRIWVDGLQKLLDFEEATRFLKDIPRRETFTGFIPPKIAEEFRIGQEETARIRREGAFAQTTGPNITFNIENIMGLDAQNVTEAFQDIINNSIS